MEALVKSGDRRSVAHGPTLLYLNETTRRIQSRYKDDIDRNPPSAKLSKLPVLGRIFTSVGHSSDPARYVAEVGLTPSRAEAALT